MITMVMKLLAKFVLPQLLLTSMILAEENGKNISWVDSGLLQGDINMEEKDFLAHIERDNADFDLEHNAPDLVQLSAVRDTSVLWPKGVMPYYISNSFTQREKNMIYAAIADFKKKTCIRLVPRTTQRNYVYFQPLSGCYSNIGKNRAAGSQTISLARGGCFYHGTIIHEIMHALGFYHEQTRNDRDDWVYIHWGNISPTTKYNFDKIDIRRINHLNTPYDYSSVMHYPEYAFSINRRATISKKKRSSKTLGNRSGFSQWDIVRINRLYKCDKTTTTPEPEVIKPGPGDCSSEIDYNRFCSDWTRKGECGRNPAHMWVYCKKSCCESSDKRPVDGKLKKGCKHFPAGSSIHCNSWAKRGFCTGNPAYMLKSCQQACCQYKGIGEKKVTESESSEKSKSESKSEEESEESESKSKSDSEDDSSTIEDSSDEDKKDSSDSEDSEDSKSEEDKDSEDKSKDSDEDSEDKSKDSDEDSEDKSKDSDEDSEDKSKDSEEDSEDKSKDSDDSNEDSNEDKSADSNENSEDKSEDSKDKSEDSDEKKEKKCKGKNNDGPLIVHKKYCDDWAKKGECTKNADNMLANCAKSCCLYGKDSSTP